MGVPVKYDELTNTYCLFGFFCCWNCAAAFASDSSSSNMHQKARVWIYQILRSFLNATQGHVTYEQTVCRPSPHWSLLKAYGGPWDVDTYMRNIRDMRVLHHVVPPWFKWQPLGYLMYEEDRTQPLPNVFTDTFQTTDPVTGMVRPAIKPVALSATTPNAHELASAASYAPIGTVAPPRPVWASQTKQQRIEQEMQRPADAQALRFRTNVLTGRREVVPPLSDTAAVHKG